MVFWSVWQLKTGDSSSREGVLRGARGSRSQLLQNKDRPSGFPRDERLLKRADFLRVSGLGQKIHSTNFLIIRQRSTLPAVRIGITVSRKVGNSVMRNRLKRLIREFYRLNKNLFIWADYNIIAKQGAARLAYKDVCLELSRVLQR